MHMKNLVIENAVLCNVDYHGVHCSSVSKSSKGMCFHLSACGKEQDFYCNDPDNSDTVEDIIKKAVDKFIGTLGMSDKLLVRLDDQNITKIQSTIVPGETYIYNHRVTTNETDIINMDGKMCVVSQKVADSPMYSDQYAVWFSGDTSLRKVYGCELRYADCENSPTEEFYNDRKELQAYRNMFGKIYFMDVIRDRIFIMYHEPRSDFMYSDDCGISWHPCNQDTDITKDKRIFRMIPAGVFFGVNSKVMCNPQKYEYSADNGMNWQQVAKDDYWLYRDACKNVWFRPNVNSFGWGKTFTGAYYRKIGGSSDVEIYKIWTWDDNTFSVLHGIVDTNNSGFIFSEITAEQLLSVFVEKYFVASGETGLIYRWENFETAESFILASITSENE